ncbi:PEP/pyruvate-binding domain-containing protein, partial [Alphaproteobacteria bacterium]|nr:PEP/pyruvate-binding domain-containing protein [Alphaproteobacteria bacterium]
MKRIYFSTKAGTLDRLDDLVKSAQIPPSLFFSGKAWRLDAENCLDTIRENLGNGPFAVRSSSQSEDTGNASQAGKFLSVLDVTAENLSLNIELVLNSYGTWNEEDEVLVQPMLRDVKLSGVAFSHDPNTSSPYRIINYSEGTDTTSITGGQFGGLIWQQAAASPKEPPVELVPIITLIDELLEIFDHQPLDIEFCFTSGGAKALPWLLQARPLVFNNGVETPNEQTYRLKELETYLRQKMKRHPWISGRKTVFGVMPDWNPAEIIGTRPKSLALSLYKELITNTIWAYQRHNYGYRNLRSFPLMVDFSGLPYIDVRLSFNSFIPSNLDPILSEKLVDYYIDRLVSSPNLHDKVEFDIVFSCYTFDLENRIKAI